ncbi:MAG: hypothetical protein JWO38_5282 [Gemmataceae bacterium]|nr:hypothetical protein [Gemmataceae bacterium]
MRAVLLAAAGLVLVAADPAPPLPVVAKAESLPDWNAKFRPTDGWVGADGAYSAPVSDRRTLWLFSDTWVGSVRDGKRVGVAMVNNTVGIQDGRGPDAKVSFVVKQTTAGKPTAILTPPDGRGWFWINAGVHVNGPLVLFLPRLEKTTDPGAFGFRQVDQWLGVVENPAADPTVWKVTYSKLPFAEFTPGRTLSFGAAVLREGNHVYVYGYEEKPGKPFPVRRMVLARAPADKLADFGAWRFYSGGEWKADAKTIAPLADGLATEYSVSYLPGLKQYVAVYTENGLGDRIVGRFAASPVGPWSEPVLFYRCPEMTRNKKVFSYAAKAHPHLGGGNELVISYCVNAFELAPVIEDASLYWPTFVRVRLE